ncbi:MAG: hypothetical protein M5U23_04970 [Acidimicrobiia bacterium]|nr:hypothetical protein [Acidimicrobiia bacterium]
MKPNTRLITAWEELEATRVMNCRLSDMGFEAPLAWNLNYFVLGTIRFELLRKVPNVKRSDRGGEGS